MPKDHSSNGWLQLEFRINAIPFKYLSNTLATSAFLKLRIHWEMDGRSYFREIKKHCILKKICSLRLNAVTYKGKHFFRNNYFGSHPFLMTCYFSKIFEHPPVIAEVCYFSVHKLIGWEPANIYLFKANSRNTIKKGMEYAQSLQ